MDPKKPTLVSTEVFVKPNNPKGTFFQKRRNVVLLAVSATIALALLILVPVLKLVYFKKRGEDSKPQQQADASTYAVVKANFPDPCLIKVDGGYYSFATRPLSNTTIHIQVASATNSISNWTLLEGYDALPKLPPWVKDVGDHAIWAPQVMQREDGVFLMVFSALHKYYPRKHCLGMATSETILGPYEPVNSTEPLLCHASLGGIIDPTFLQDPVMNQTYLIYKNDGNAIGSGGACGNSKWPNAPTTFEKSILTQPGLTTLASSNDSRIPLYNQTTVINSINNASMFMHNTQGDGPNIESPQAWYQEYPVSGKPNRQNHRAYHLLYNSGCFADKSYRIEHLVCWLNDNQTSFVDCPWQQLKDNSTSSLLLQTGTYKQPGSNPPAVLYAPGGPGVDQFGQYMAFHADIVPSWFDKVDPGQPDGKNRTQVQAARGVPRQRALFIAELEMDTSTEGDGTGLKIKRLVLPGA